MDFRMQFSGLAIKISLLFILVTNLAVGQSVEDSLAGFDPDELFKRGRQEAFEGNRAKGRVYLMKALDKNPDYDEIRVFLARTYLWDGMRAQAEETLKPLLDKSPNDQEAIKVMIDAAYWEKDYETALQWINKALAKNTTDKDLTIKKVQALNELERYSEAMPLVEGLMQRFPGDKDVISLVDAIKIDQKRNSLTAIVNYDFFSELFSTASMYSLQYGRRTNKGSLFFRINQSHRFSSMGRQVEVDAYPVIAKGVYAFLNYGYSSSALFPQHRAGGELYVALPWSMEASAGLRYLYFGADNGIAMYTATVGKYIKSYWLSGRVFITPNDAGTTQSYIFQARRYFSKANQFIGIMGGFGFSPDMRNFQTSDGFSSVEIYNLKSKRIGLTYQHPWGKVWQVTGALDYALQEFILTSGDDDVGIWTANVALRYSF